MDEKDAQLNQDLSAISEAWRNMSSEERKALEKNYKTYGNKDKAVSATLEEWDSKFGTPRKVIEYSTDRDIYDALKSVYDRSGGDWEMVAKVAKYNNIPKETMDKFIKNDQWTNYSTASEAGSGIGAIERGAFGNLYGGARNIATGGKYAEKYVDEVPEGLDYADASHSLFSEGVKQSKAYGRSLAQTNPGMEISGQIVGSLAPLGVASKATRGIKAAEDASKLVKAGAIGLRGAATGALANVPQALSEDSLEKALKTTGDSALTFGAADLILAGAGKALGTIGRGISRTTKAVSTPGENLTKSFEKLKPLAEMSEAMKKQGIKEGWIKNGEVNVTEYLAKKHGMNATQTMEDLANVAKTNRQVYNKLKSELKNFNYKDALKIAAKDAEIPNAPLSRVNRLLKALPERLEKFSDDIIGFTEEEGMNLAQTMRAFNQEIKHELRTIRNPSILEQKAINQYLKDVETANMKQFMVKKLPSELKAVDKPKTLGSELGRIFQITNPVTLVRALENVAKDKVERNYIRQIVAGEKYRPGLVQRLLQGIGRGENMQINTEKLRMPQQVVNEVIYKQTKKD